MAVADTKPDDLARETVAGFREAAHGLGPEAAEAFNAYAEQVTEALASIDQLAADKTELFQKRDLIPDAGYRRLLAEAKTEAGERYATAQRQSRQALARFEAVLLDEATPKLDPEREMLSRGVFDAAVRNKDADAAATMLLRAAEEGQSEVVAVAATSYGKAALTSMGVAYDEVISSVKRIAAAKADTPAGSAYRSIGRLGAASTAAELYADRVRR